MADEMINKTKPYNKSTGTQGIGDTIDLMEEYDMNVLNDPIERAKSQSSRSSVVAKHSKNS